VLKIREEDLFTQRPAPCALAPEERCHPTVNDFDRRTTDVIPIGADWLSGSIRYRLSDRRRRRRPDRGAHPGKHRRRLSRIS
jgi:hypothetical protein